MGTQPWSGQNFVQEGPQNAASYISWDDVQTFIEQLNDAAGAAEYRLPTEAEWEYACRAGTSTLWSFGDDESLWTATAGMLTMPGTSAYSTLLLWGQNCQIRGDCTTCTEVFGNGVRTGSMLMPTTMNRLRVSIPPVLILARDASGEAGMSKSPSSPCGRAVALGIFQPGSPTALALDY